MDIPVSSDPVKLGMTTPTPPEGGKLLPCIYVASRASVPERPQMWRDMRAAGWPIVSSWIDEAGPGETACMTDLWSRIHAEISVASLLLMYVEKTDLPLKGAYVEAGIALALGKPILVVTDCDIGSWTKHPQVRVQNQMPLLPEAEAIMSRYALNTRADQWQPIETAPKDGTEVDLWRNGERLCGWKWDEACRSWSLKHSYPAVTTVLGLPMPTHWMPLPAPPRAAA